jgi:hypothetical protein
MGCVGCFIWFQRQKRLKLSCEVDECQPLVPGDFIVHLAGLKGVAKCLMFRHYYTTAHDEMVSKLVGWLTDNACHVI